MGYIKIKKYDNNNNNNEFHFDKKIQLIDNDNDHMKTQEKFNIETINQKSSPNIYILIIILLNQNNLN
jgi:hypothetical protein